MNILRPLSPPFIRSMILLSTLLFTTCLLSHLIGFDPYLIMERVKGSFLLHALRALFRLFGLEMPVCLLLSLVALVGGCSSLHMMEENSAGGQPAAEQPANLPPSPGWTTIFEDYSGGNSVGSSEPSVNQPPLIPELHPPLLDDDTRRAELASRLRTLLWGKAYREEMIDSVVDTQVQIEKHIQAALVERDYSVESLLAKRHQIRGLIFSPNGEALSQRTYALHLKEILQLGTVQSLPFRRVESAIKNLNLLLDKA